MRQACLISGGEKEKKIIICAVGVIIIKLSSISLTLLQIKAGVAVSRHVLFRHV
jgi:hypothetical protein